MQFIKYILFIFSVALLQNIIAQTKTVDSLKNSLSTSLHDCRRAEILFQLGKECQENNQNDLAIRYAKQCLDLSINLDCKKTLIKCYNLIGIAFDDNGNYPEAKKSFQIGLNLSLRLKDDENASIFYTNLGETFRNQADYAKAMDCYLKGLKIDEGKHDEARIVSDYFTLTLLFGNLDEVQQQKKYLSKALFLAKKIGNKRVEAKCYNIYANILVDEDKQDSALYFYEKSLKLAKEIDLKHLQAKVLANIGGVYRDKKDYPNAIIYANEGIRLNTEIGDYRFLAADYVSIGWMYNEMKDYGQSKSYFNKALELSKNKFIDSEINTYRGLSFLFAKTNNYEEAFNYHVKYVTLKDSIYNSENSKQLGDIKTNFEVEKKEAELKAEQEILRAVSFEEKRHQRIIIVVVVCFLVIVLVFAFFLFKRYKLTNQQKEIIELKSKETSDQKSLLEEKQKEIIDSIKYAKRIQNAILPQTQFLEKHLSDYFILYQPKDIIAGDFYWMHSTIDGKVFIAAADSTGHGVPGTIVSIVCSNALDKAVKEFKLTDTGKILDKTTELVLETFAKSGEEINDGMDISLLCIDKVNRKITWSGANNSLLYCSQNSHEEKGEIALHHIKANKQPIGKSENQIPFKTHDIIYKEGTVFYLMTDGYQDQFGGPNGKKFKYKQLEILISRHCNYSLDQQIKALHDAFFSWKGELEQVDDVTIIGIKI